MEYQETTLIRKCSGGGMAAHSFWRARSSCITISSLMAACSSLWPHSSSLAPQLLVGPTAPQRDQRDSTDPYCLLTAIGPKGMSAQGQVGVRERLCLRGQWAQPWASGAQGASGHHCQTLGLDLGWSYAKLGVGLNGPCGSLPTEDAPWFCARHFKTHRRTCSFVVLQLWGWSYQYKVLL